MDKWAPLEPSRPSTSASNKRFSLNAAISSVTASRNAYVPASAGVGVAGFTSLLGSPTSATRSERYDDPASGAGGGAASGTTSSVTDAFPVGRIPSSVSIKILQYTPLPVLVNCALASRNFARVVADESIWRWRLEALDWHEVDGLHDPPELDEIRSEEAQDRQAKAQTEKAAENLTKGSSAPVGKTGAGPQRQASDDDFGDFTGGKNNDDAGNDSFGAFSSAPAIKPGASMAGRGGSLANGFASISIANGHQPPQQRNSLAPSFTPLTPSRPSIQRPGPGPAGAKALFSFQAEAKLPSPSRLRPYRALRARTQQMQRYIDSFLSSTSPIGSLLFTEATMGLTSQPALLGNIARFISCPCMGVSISKADQLWPKVLEAASYLHGILLPAFEGAEARRADAVRAGRISGAEHTKRAVERAERDMKQHAGAIWQLGQALGRGNPHALITAMAEPLAGDDSRDVFVIDESEGMNGNGRRADSSAEAAENLAISAAQAFLEKRDIFEGGAQFDPQDNFIQRGGEVRLDFTPMDSFMKEVLATVKSDGCLIARVFPPEQDVVLAFADRVAGEVVSEKSSG